MPQKKTLGKLNNPLINGDDSSDSEDSMDAQKHKRERHEQEDERNKWTPLHFEEFNEVAETELHSAKEREMIEYPQTKGFAEILCMEVAKEQGDNQEEQKVPNNGKNEHVGFNAEEELDNDLLEMTANYEEPLNEEKERIT